jgi:hypothetical protein
MRWLAVVLCALGSLAVGCGGGDCAKSADIQVTVAPDGDVVVQDIVTLHVMLSINDQLVGSKDIDVGPNLPLKQMGSTFLLHPDPAPAASYSVALTVQAYAIGNTLVAIGSDSMQAVTNGCNLMTVHLTALPFTPPGDMAAPPGADLSQVGGDMAGCVGGMPDEDADGRADFCDLCPDDADSTPVDTDGDGLPDACDPDVAAKTNRLVYFDPFNSASGHWPGNNTVTNSFMTLDSGPGQIVTGNATDMLPANVRVQTHLFPNGFYTNATAGVDAGLFVGTSTNLNAASGAWCLISSTDKKLELYPVNNGTVMTPTLANIGTVSGMVYRLRLTNSNGVWTCEMVVGTDVPVTVSTSQAVTAPLFISLIVDGSRVNFHSVVAETKL